MLLLCQFCARAFIMYPFSSSFSFDSDASNDPPPRDWDSVRRQGIFNPSRHPSAPPSAAISALSLWGGILLPLCICQNEWINVPAGIYIRTRITDTARNKVFSELASPISIFQNHQEAIFLVSTLGKNQVLLLLRLSLLKA